MFTTDLPEQFDCVLTDTDVPTPVRDRSAEQIKDGIHYDTAEARCLGHGEEETKKRTIYRGLYRGENGHYFRHRIDRVNDLWNGIGNWWLGGTALTPIAWLFVMAIVGLPMLVMGDVSARLLRAMVIQGVTWSILPGGIAGMALHVTRRKLYELTNYEKPMTVEDKGIEPLSHADILKDSQSTPERKLAEQIRDQQPTWEGSTGTVTELPDGTYVYEHDEGATACDGRDTLRSKLEEQNDPELYRKVFDDYQSA